MFKLHDSIVVSPECAVSDTSNTPNRGEVIYIHPNGRYYVLEFKFPIGTIRETRRFSDGELIAAMNAGLLGNHAQHPTGISEVQGSVCEDGSACDDEFAAMMSELGC